MYYFYLFISQDENLITQILDIMVHPQKFFEYEPTTAQNKLPEFYAFVEKKVKEFLYIRPYKRKWASILVNKKNTIEENTLLKGLKPWQHYNREISGRAGMYYRI